MTDEAWSSLRKNTYLSDPGLDGESLLTELSLDPGDANVQAGHPSDWEWCLH